MRSTKLNGTKASRRYGTRWLGAATAVALVAGSATMATAASRTGLRTEAQRASTVSFNWQTFAPGHLVPMEPAHGSSGSAGNLNFDGLRAPAVGFAWRTFAPGHMDHNDLPNGSNNAALGGMRTDALRAPSASFHWQSFSPGHIVHGETPNGAGTTAPGGLRTDAMRTGAFRPSLVYGLGLDDAGGVRAQMGVSFHMR